MPPNPLMANCDADLLKQAALNVIQNGAQAMPSSVAIETKPGGQTSDGGGAIGAQ